MVTPLFGIPARLYVNMIVSDRMEEFILTIVTILEVQIILFKERVCERDEDGRRRQQVKLLEWIVRAIRRLGLIFLWVTKTTELMVMDTFLSLWSFIKTSVILYCLVWIVSSSGTISLRMPYRETLPMEYVRPPSV
jgi:hypothetical protein